MSSVIHKYHPTRTCQLCDERFASGIEHKGIAEPIGLVPHSDDVPAHDHGRAVRFDAVVALLEVLQHDAASAPVDEVHQVSLVAAWRKLLLSLWCVKCVEVNLPDQMR